MNKPYWEMSTSELASATAQFDEPSVADKSRPLTPTEKARWRKVKRKRGRPRTGKGFRRISISIEKGLLGKVDAYVKKRKVSRSRFMAEALEQLMAEES